MYGPASDCSRGFFERVALLSFQRPHAFWAHPRERPPTHIEGPSLAKHGVEAPSEGLSVVEVYRLRDAAVEAAQE